VDPSANEWWHPRLVARQLKAIEAEDGADVGEVAARARLADALAAAHTGGKAVSVSPQGPRRDLAARTTPARRSGYDAHRVAWTSLTPPPWLAAWNAAQPMPAQPPRRGGRRLPETAQLARVPDDAPGEIGIMGLGPTFPHASDATGTPPPRSSRTTDRQRPGVFDTATPRSSRRAPRRRAPRPDLLILSLSAHDYIGHGWGQESWESWDTVLRLDRRLDRFPRRSRRPDRRRPVGDDRRPAITALSPMPESVNGGRISFEQIKDAARNRAATAELGPRRLDRQRAVPHRVPCRPPALAQKPQKTSPWR